MSEKVVDFMPETGFNEIAMDFNMHETGVVGRVVGFVPETAVN